MVNVFLDSDIVISSLISNTGASYQLINNKNIVCFISNVSFKELSLVVKKLNLDDTKFNKIVKGNLKTCNLSLGLKQIKANYKKYVKDINDAHIISGAVESKVNFLITYNIKDFEINKIKEKYNIKVMTPGTFLQFLRSK